MPTRRKLLKLGALASIAETLAASAHPGAQEINQTTSWNGTWSFHLDPENSGESQGWHRPETPAGGWRDVTVPHTWQIEPEHTGYMGVGWYRRMFDAPLSWSASAVRVEFEAVFHTATVWLNGAEVGRHTGKGYTAFMVDLGPRLRFGTANTLVVRAGNAFNESMLPRGGSSDWAHDGGIYRPVNLLVTPQIFIERIQVDAEPDLTTGSATAQVKAVVRNASGAAWEGNIAARLIEGVDCLRSGCHARQACARRTENRYPPGRRSTVLCSGISTTRVCTGQRSPYRTAMSAPPRSESARSKCANDGFFLNGERVRLMGAERTAGSNPSSEWPNPQGGSRTIMRISKN